MKLAFFAVAGVAAAILINTAPAATAAEISNAPQAGTQSVEEISAAKKRRIVFAEPTYVDAITGEIVNPFRPRYIAPSHDFVGGPDGYPGEYAMRRAAGQCVMDFGYGRWRAC
ncbi:hypothetical protein [Pseudorhodoplanes sinuspersici]|uniref:Uncharacterized protein n=1 Tax=Pseudorhodoplanes sinuspersici TaxID=1235591 RepID=A0A1W6ZTQ2_9HYPH|nr:hypothetical protein [Pseudorhodoplanes sinuspersici]ARQ00777.1 hypothetical protein CAK95_18055 [Pseudorhodoplanes sinuspersici]RKE72391.1 hypothetical protein DFP91_0256 [Pseudorhodoplanes sinuspersici]